MNILTSQQPQQRYIIHFKSILESGCQHTPVEMGHQKTIEGKISNSLCPGLSRLQNIHCNDLQPNSDHCLLLVHCHTRTLGSEGWLCVCVCVCVCVCARARLCMSMCCVHVCVFISGSHATALINSWWWRQTIPEKLSTNSILKPDKTLLYSITVKL
jgi:hypothetical protein